MAAQAVVLRVALSKCLGQACSLISGGQAPVSKTELWAVRSRVSRLCRGSGSKKACRELTSISGEWRIDLQGELECVLIRSLVFLYICLLNHSSQR